MVYGTDWPEVLLLEWNWSIVDHAPLAPHLAAIRWEVWLRDQEAARRWKAQVAEERERAAREGPPVLHLPRAPAWAPGAWKREHDAVMLCRGIGLGLDDQLVRLQLDWTRRLPRSHFTDDPRHPKLCPRCRTLAGIKARKVLREAEAEQD